MSELEHPKRMTLSTVIERLTEKTPAAAKVPTFQAGQVKGVGGSTVFEWDVVVPVCDEFPSSDEAFEALVRYSARLASIYPPSDPPAAKGSSASPPTVADIRAGRRRGGEA